MKDCQTCRHSMTEENDDILRCRLLPTWSVATNADTFGTTVFERDSLKEWASARTQRKWPATKCGPEGANYQPKDQP